MGAHSGTDEALGRLGSRLRALGYDSKHLRLRLGRIPDRLTASVLVMAECRAGDDELGQAIRFWCLGLPLQKRALEAVLDPAELTVLETAGLAERRGDEVAAAVRITPALRQLFVHDFDRGDRLGRDHVIGISPATRSLAGLTPRTQVERALDIGSGCGVQALGLTVHADEVVATDISERAAWATRASAALSEVDGVVIRTGDGLEPVAGERFDLIVSNPPFVVSPGSEMTFRDAGTRGDTISRSLVQGIPGHLSPGGVAVVLLNWIVRAGETVTEAAEGWLSGLPVKALLLHHETLDPPAYAQRWPLLPARASVEEHRSTVDRWISELERLGARWVASGAVVMERTDSESGVRVVKMPRRPSHGGGQVRRMLDAVGRFDGATDPSLPTTRFRLLHGHRIDQRLHYGHGRYEAAPARMRLDESAGVVAAIPAELLEAVFRLDGDLSLGEVTAAIAAGRDQPEVELAAALDPVVLELYEEGFLEIVEATPPTPG